MTEDLNWWRTGSSYILWLITSALGLFDFYIAWGVLRLVAVRLGADQWTLPLVQRCGMLILAVLWIVLFFWIEAWYRRLAQKNMGGLIRAFAWITGGQVGFLGLAYMVTLL